MRSYAADNNVVVDDGVGMETYVGDQATVSTIRSAFVSTIYTR